MSKVNVKVNLTASKNDVRKTAQESLVRYLKQKYRIRTGVR